MTVASSTNRAQFLGSGSSGPFTFNFRFFAKSEIIVIRTAEDDTETLLAEGVDYTITGAGSVSGGAVTLTDPLSTGDGLTVVRTLNLDQPTGIRNLASFFPEVHEDVFDRIVMQVQQISELNDRAIKMPATAAGDFTVPSGPRAGKVLGFDEDGAPGLLSPPSVLHIYRDNPWIDDRAYATLTAADTAAVSLGLRLVISKVWAVVPATLAADIIMLPGSRLNGNGSTAIIGAFQGSVNCIGQNQNVTGLRGSEILEVWFYCPTADRAFAINKAQTAGQANQVPTKFSGSRSVTATIAYKAPIIGSSSSDALVTTITDGSAVILIDNVDRWKLESFKILGLGDVLQNFIGVRSINTCNRFFMSDVFVYKGAMGFDLNGWIFEIQNAWAFGCTTGFKGTTLNGGLLQINAEGCGTGLFLTDSSGTEVTGTIEGNTIGAIIDNASLGIDLLGVYMEGNGTHAIIGQTAGIAAQCHNINIVGGKYVGDGEGIIADNVDGFSLVGNPYILSSVRATANAVNADVSVSLPTIGTSTAQQMLYRSNLRDDSRCLKKIYNYFPNPTFKNGIKGLKDTYTDKAVGSIETALVRDVTAWKITATIGQANNNTLCVLPDAILNELKGKTVIAAAWVYIPDMASYQGVAPSFAPDFKISYIDGATTETGTSTKSYREGGWNFMARKIAVPATATELRLVFYANRGPNVMTEAAYIVVTDVFLGIWPLDFKKLAAELWESHPLAGKFEGGAYVMSASAIPTDVSQYYSVGDRVINSVPTVGQPKAWVCTVASTLHVNVGTWVSEGNL